MIALARARTRHIKNTHVACRTSKALYGVFPHLLMILLFSTLLITHFSIDSLNTLYVFTKNLDLVFFFHIINFSFSCACYLFNLNGSSHSDILTHFSC